MDVVSPSKKGGRDQPKVHPYHGWRYSSSDFGDGEISTYA